jgi:preprotein translocase subunit SecA
MAGRGTDIKLGDGVKELGGLYILGTGRHESRRIDLQLRGRSGRQGDPGESIFFLSLEDDLMRLFGSDRIAKVMDRMGVEEGEVITHPMVTRSIERAQKKVEARNFGIRKHLLEYDDVMNQQREIVYDRRNYALHGANISREVDDIMEDYMDNIIELYCSTGSNPQEWEGDEFTSEVMNTFSLDIKSENDRIGHIDELRDMVIQGSHAILTFKKEAVDEALFDHFQKWVVFRTIDENWREHLAAMDQLREGIGLRAYGQKNPLIEYKQEGFGMFAEMMVNTNRETLKRIFRTNIQQGEQKPAAPQPMPGNLKMRHDESAGMGFTAPPQGAREGAQATAQNQSQRQPIMVEEKTGRNEPCPCGSGKKFKKCCGKTI